MDKEPGGGNACAEAVTAQLEPPGVSKGQPPEGHRVGLGTRRRSGSGVSYGKMTTGV